MNENSSEEQIVNKKKTNEFWFLALLQTFCCATDTHTIHSRTITKDSRCKKAKGVETKFLFYWGFQ